MWIWIIATLAAFFIKGLCGFANTLVFTSIMGFGANNVNISPIELVLGFPANIVMTFKNRKKLDPKIYVPLAILVLAGAIPGALLLKNVNASIIKIVFGAVVILVGIEMFFRDSSNSKVKGSKIFMAIVGLASGVLCGLFGVGALLAAYVGRTTDSSDAFKANISAVFTVDNVFRIILYSLMGIITIESLKMSLILIPFMLAGLFGGMYCSKLLNDKVIKKLVIVLLIISGVVLIIKNI